jgi:hypothetical protein
MLRVTIEHQLKNVRMVEPEPDAVDQANSALEKESLLQRGKQEQTVASDDRIGPWSHSGGKFRAVRVRP